MTTGTQAKEQLTQKNQKLQWLDRDQSLLAFNARVLDWAKRPEVPLLERLRYLCIVSSNLDEFFEVRAALYASLDKPLAPLDEAGMLAQDSLSQVAHALVQEQYALYNDVLMPAFAKEGVRILSYSERTLAQHQWVKTFFEREVRPLLLQSCQQVQGNLVAVVVELSSQMQPEQLLMHATEPSDRAVAAPATGSKRKAPTRSSLASSRNWMSSLSTRTFSRICSMLIMFSSLGTWDASPSGLVTDVSPISDR